MTPEILLPTGEVSRDFIRVEDIPDPDLIDASWLQQFGVNTADMTDDSLQQLVDVGSQPLNFPTACDNRRTDIYEARGVLLDTLGYNDGSSVRTAIEKANSLLLPSDRVLESIHTQLYLELDAKKIVERVPTSLWFYKKDFVAKYNKYLSHGTDPVNVFNRQPANLTLSDANIDGTFALYSELGLNGAKIVNRQPGSMGYSDKKIRSNVSFAKRTLKAWGFSEVKACEFIEDNSQLIGMAKRNLHARARIISSTEGIDPEEMQSGLISIPTESLLVARTKTSDTVELFRLARKHKRQYNNGELRRKNVQEVLEDPDCVRELGEKVIRAYMLYATGN